MNHVHRASLLPGLAVVILGCSSAPPRAERTASESEPDAIGDNEHPGVVIPGASSLLADNVVAADVGATFGVDDDHIPYPDTYWPFDDDGIAARWEDGPSPLDKYMALSDPTRADAAKKWEVANHGSKVPGVKSWFGHCPGWAGASTVIAPVKHAVTVRFVNGAVADCGATDTDCTTFAIGDLDALAAEIYNDADSRFIGARCDTAPSHIARDQYGRIVRDGSGCKGLNAGALMVVLGQQMKRLHRALIIDAQNDYNTDQIWNQPAYRYTVNRYEPIDAVTAANLVASGARTGALTRYLWNDAAAGFVLVDASILWVAERGPNVSYVSGLESTERTRFVAVIELDRAPSDPQARIIGGEYIVDSSVGADRLTVPPFVWVAIGPGPEGLPTGVGGDWHNPYVRPSIVAELLRRGASAQ